MAVHIRHALRQEIQARLVGLPHAADAVATPVDSLEEIKGRDDVPCAAVEIGNETIALRKGDDDTGYTLHRETSVAIWLASKRTATSAMEKLEEMAAEVELRMLGDWEGFTFILESTEFDDERRRGVLPFRAATLTYRVTYKTRQGDASQLA